jgi:hypothetical protein
VKVLLDQMYPAVIAEQLRDRGHDVQAVVEDDELIGLPDPPLFGAAQADERAVVTENVSDFMPLHSEYAGSGQPHHGLIFTSNNKFPRGAAGTVGALVSALDEFLNDPPPLEPADGWVHWL